MSRHKRPIEVYREAARVLAETFPAFAKYIDPDYPLSSAAKAAIAHKKYQRKEWKRAPKRDDASYLSSAKEIMQFVPGLKKYKRRKKLKPHEKAHVARYENKLRYIQNLVPVSEAQAKKLKGKLYAPGVRAIQLENTGKHVELKVVKKDLFITTNGRTWIYWALDRFHTSDLAKAGTTAFQHLREAFPLEQIADLADRAFKTLKPKSVYLWTAHGRAGEGFNTLDEFMQWLFEEWSGYREPERWARGLAIWV